MPLDATSYPAVPYRFPEFRAPSGVTLAFVQDAPNEYELRQGRHMRGSAGTLFMGMLRSANIDHRACFFGHVQPHDPADPPNPDALKRLLTTLDGLGPCIVIPLGQEALRALGSDANLTATRGSAFYLVDGARRLTILPTFHPETIQKVWKQYIVGVGDLTRAASLRTDEITYPTRKLLVSPTLAEVRDFCALDRLRAAGPLLSCDIETGWGQIRGLSFAPSEHEAIYIPFISLAKVSRSYWDTLAAELEVWWIVKQVLESPLPKLGQNFAGYDVPWLLAKVGIRAMNVQHDLRLLHAALYPELPKSLQFMGLSYSQQGAWKHWAKGHSSVAELIEKRDA